MYVFEAPSGSMPLGVKRVVLLQCGHELRSVHLTKEGREGREGKNKGRKEERGERGEGRNESKEGSEGRKEGRK